jgi:hypothetical protein
MANLMTIPREIRDMILSLALLARRQPPSTISQIEQEERAFIFGRKYLPGTAVYSSTNAADYGSSALPLLLTSKQVREETLENIRRDLIHYEIDVKFVKERFLVPTWISIPVFSPRVHHLHATFQSLGAYERKMGPLNLKGPPYGIGDIWRMGCGGPPLYVWTFYYLLVRFLEFGATGPVGSRSSRGVTVDCMELDFVDPEDTHFLPPGGDERHSAILHAYGAGGWSHEPVQMLRPEWLAKNLAGNISGLLSMSYHEASYGAMLYEQIGRIVFKVNGNILHEFDLGQMLAELKFHDNFGGVVWHQRVHHFTNWKQTTMKDRAKRGLKVVEPSVNWRQEAQAVADRIYAGRVA